MLTAAAGVMLMLCAIEDWRTGKVSVWCPTACMIVSTAIRAGENSLSTADFLLGMLIGLTALAVGAVSRGQMGTGDGLVLTACGMCIGWKALVLLLFWESFIFLGIGVAGILLRKWTAEKNMAFVPFLWAAFMLICLAGSI